jgi:hypothetical protein
VSVCTQGSHKDRSVAVRVGRQITTYGVLHLENVLEIEAIDATCQVSRSSEKQDERDP